MSAAWSWDRSSNKAPKGGDSLRRPANKTGYSYSIKGGPAPARPPREFLESQSYETAPPVRAPQPAPRNHDSNTDRTSSFRPTSSIYSQPSPMNANFSSAVSGANYQYGAALDDISPPSSPEPSYTTSHGPRVARGRSRDVSPIDEGMSAMSHAPHNTASNARASPQGQHSGDGPQSRSNIPMMRRARRKQSDAALREAHSKDRLATQRQSQQKGEVRWDAMTGEQTSSETGKSSQVKPAEFARGLSASPPSASQQRSPTAAITSFGDRVRRMAQGGGKTDRKPNRVSSGADPAAGSFAPSRPGWRGASGRTAQVEPVRDNPEVTPLKIPRKSSKRVASPMTASGQNPSLSSGILASGQAAPAGPPGPETTAKPQPRDTVRRVVPSSQMSSPPPSSKQVPGPGGQGHSSSPLSGSFDGTDAPTIAARALQSSVTGGSATQPPNIAAQGAARDKPPGLRRKPPPAHANHSHQDSVSSVYSQDPQPPVPPPHGANPVNTQTADPWTQPASRFSVTTYATSATGTPRGSFDTFDHDRPPVPTAPQQYRDDPRAMQESVMDRQRPKLSGAGDDQAHPTAGGPIVVSFKDSLMSSPFANPSAAARQRQAAATGTGPSPAAVARARTTTERPVSTASTASSINKSLPPAPPETTAGEARDRVGILNAQLQSLGNRRINLLRSVKQMTELMPQDNVLDSADVIHKREMERRKVEVLRQELADVQRQEYELGLKLHRAYKRMDRDADWENSALWVRRVTG